MRLTIVVDDNALQAHTRKTILERAGQKVTIAAGGVEALTLLEKPDMLEQTGLVISDHLMPGMNGPELVSEIRSLLPSVPILILSGLPSAEEEYQGLEVTFRNKPFPPDALIALTRELLLTPLGRIA